MCVSILLARGLVQAVQSCDIRGTDLLAAAGIDAGRLDDVEARLDIEEYNRLLETALDLTGDAALGLKLGETAHAPTYNLIAHLLAHARTLRDGMQALLHFHRLLVDRPAYHMRESAGQAVLLCEEYPGPERCCRLRTEMGVVGLYRLLKYFARGEQPERVSFAHPAPPYRSAYARAFGGLERFEQSFSGVVIPSALLDVPQPNHDSRVYAALERQACERIARMSAVVTYGERLRDHVMMHPRAEQRSMESAARALGLSVRSLRRRLHEEGASFQKIVDGALHTLSRQLLSDPQRPIKEVALTFGFVEPASFCRAFKRWSGTTPSEYRAKGTRAAGVARKSAAAAAP